MNSLLRVTVAFGKQAKGMPTVNRFLRQLPPINEWGRGRGGGIGSNGISDWRKGIVLGGDGHLIDFCQLPRDRLRPARLLCLGCFLPGSKEFTSRSDRRKVSLDMRHRYLIKRWLIAINWHGKKSRWSYKEEEKGERDKLTFDQSCCRRGCQDLRLTASFLSYSNRFEGRRSPSSWEQMPAVDRPPKNWTVTVG